MSYRRPERSDRWPRSARICEHRSIYESAEFILRICRGAPLYFFVWQEHSRSQHRRDGTSCHRAEPRRHECASGRRTRPSRHSRAEKSSTGGLHRRPTHRLPLPRPRRQRNRPDPRNTRRDGRRNRVKAAQSVSTTDLAAAARSATTQETTPRQAQSSTTQAKTQSISTTGSGLCRFAASGNSNHGAGASGPSTLGASRASVHSERTAAIATFGLANAIPGMGGASRKSHERLRTNPSAIHLG